MTTYSDPCVVDSQARLSRWGEACAGGPHTTFRFAGEEYDLKAREQGTFGLTGTNGLYYLRARYYDPTIGRFLTRDPLPGSIQHPQSLNAYPYVQNNPVNRMDPTGLFSEGSPGFSCLSLVFLLASVALLAFAPSPLTASLAVALLLYPVILDIARDDPIGTTLDLGVAGSTSWFALAGTVLARRIATQLIFLNLAYTGLGCAQELQVGDG